MAWLSTCVLEEARTYKVECKGGGGGSALKFKLDRPDIRFDHSGCKIEICLLPSKCNYRYFISALLSKNV